MHNNLLCS